MRFLAGVAVVVLVGMGAGVALFADRGDSAPGVTGMRQAPPPVDGVPVWQGLREKALAEAPLAASRSAQRRAMRLLRRGSDRIPAPVGRRIRASIGALPGEFKFEFTHRILRGDGLWVVGGENVTCIAYSWGRQTACDTATRAAERGLALGVGTVPHPGRAEEFIVAGLVPDPVEAVWIRAGRAARHVPVEENVYLVRARQRIILERFELKRGIRSRSRLP